MGKSTVSTAIFNSKLLVITRGYPRDSKSSKELVQTSQLPHSWTKNDKELFQEAHFQPYFVADFIWFHQLPKLAKDIEGRGPTSRCFWGCKNQSQFAEPPIESKIRPYKWLLVVFLAVKQTLLSWFPQSNTVCFNGTSPPFSMVKPLESLQVRALLIFIGESHLDPRFSLQTFVWLFDLQTKISPQQQTRPSAQVAQSKSKPSKPHFSQNSMMFAANKRVLASLAAISLKISQVISPWFQTSGWDVGRSKMETRAASNRASRGGEKHSRKKG